MATSFSSSGATPTIPLPTSLPPSTVGSSPFAKALNNAGASVNSSGNFTMPSPPPIPTPSTPVKKTTVNNVDGSSHVTEYHAPTQGLLDPSDTPITGNTKTPSGAIVDATSGGLISPPTQLPPLQQAQTGLLNTAQGNTALGQAGNAITKKYEGLINPILRGTIGQETGDRTTGTTPVGEGNAAVAAQAGGALIQGLTNQEQQELTGTGQALTGQAQQASALNAAGTLSTPSNEFMQVPYSNQVLGADGRPINGGAMGQLPQQAQDFVNSLAQQVKSGQMIRKDAESELSTYGQAGLQALNTALGSDFNTNASNASAATTATGQQIQAAITPANQALDSLQTAFNGLSSLQQGNVPGLNVNVPILGQLAQGASMQFGVGRDAASAFQGALQEARSRIDAALVGSIGVNAAAAQASALLPDNMVPSEIPQKIAAAKQYLLNQLTSYTGSGNQNNTNANANATGWF